MILKKKMQLIGGAILLSSTTFACNVQLSAEDLFVLYQQSRTHLVTLQQEKTLLTDQLNAALQNVAGSLKKVEELNIAHTSAEASFNRRVTELQTTISGLQETISSLNKQSDALQNDINVKADEFRILHKRYQELVEQNNNIMSLLGSKEKDLGRLQNKTQAQKAHILKVKDLVTSIRAAYDHDVLHGATRSTTTYRMELERIYELLI